MLSNHLVNLGGTPPRGATHTLLVPEVFDCMRRGPAEPLAVVYGDADVYEKFYASRSHNVPPDFSIRVDDCNIDTHKAVLALKSSLFRSIISKLPAKAHTMELPADLEIVTLVVRYMYADTAFRIDKKETLLDDTMHLVAIGLVADQYEVWGLSEALAECLKENLASENKRWTSEELMSVVEEVYNGTKENSVLRRELVIGLSKQEHKEQLLVADVRERLTELPEFQRDMRRVCMWSAWLGTDRSN